MMRIEDCVEISKLENIATDFSGNPGRFRVKFVIGFKAKGMECFLYKKFGAIFTNEILKPAAIALAEKNWREIIANDDWKIYDIHLFGYHFGMDYRVNDQGEILGEWPVVATLKINCDAIFPIKPVLVLPDEFAHLKMFPLPRPTGKIIE